MSELTEMEQYLQKLFTQAGNDLKKKFLKYTQDFQRLDAERQQAVKDGRMTEDEYKEWRKNKLLYGMHWQRLIDRNTSELLKYNQTAVKYINGEVPQIFASGYNHVAEQIPDSPVAGFDFELINADTVSAGGKRSLRRYQFDLAKTNATMAIWLGKQWLNQTDNPQAEETAAKTIDALIEAVKNID